MTLEMFAILVDAVAMAIETADDIQHVLAIVFISIVFGVGIWWAFSLLSFSLTKNFLFKYF
jgi:hypothetical protein